MPTASRKGVVAASLLFFSLVIALTYAWRQPILQHVPDRFKQFPSQSSSSNTQSDHGYIPGATDVELDQQGEGGDGGELEHHDWADNLTPEQKQASDENMKIKHNVLWSKMTSDKKWFSIDFLDEGGFNPSIIPHPQKENTWIAIAQRNKALDPSDIWNVELVCEVEFKNDNFTCTHSPKILPIASTVSDKCTGDYDYMNRMMGPHDGRLFHGPTKPYIMYISQHRHTCLGPWLHDFRRLFDYSTTAVTNRKQPFFWPTQLERPTEYGRQEKNWFLFWDTDNTMYVHNDIVPKRVFAKLNPDGTVGKDLAPVADAKDAKCLKDHLPKLRDNGLEWLHQSTNSLAITLCKRADPNCKKTDDNTFNMIIIQKKTFYWHGVYSPFLLLFRRTAPFEIYGISSKPFWYNGRGVPMGHWTERPGDIGKPQNQSEMVFTTAINWKQQGLGYHGYLDDDVIITFGMEDRRAGGIDVTAEDLMQDLALCD